MNALDYVLGGILIVAAIFLVIAVLMQEGKSKGIGAVGGGSADTFFGKTKGKGWEKTLSKLTTIIGVFFVVIVLVIYIKQADLDKQSDDFFDQNKDSITEATTVADDTTASPESTTVADETTAAPEETTTAPEETTTAPEETTATPEE